MYRANAPDPSKWDSDQTHEAEERAKDSGHVNILSIDRLPIKELIHVVDGAGRGEHDLQPGPQRAGVCQCWQEAHLPGKNITIGELLHRVDVLCVDGRVFLAQ